MLRTAFLVLAVALIAAASASAVTKKWYWSEEKAEARASAAVRIPHCLTSPEDPRCAAGIYRPDGRPRVGWWWLTEVTCTGADERADTFTYARFKCRFYAGVTDHDYAKGSLLLYPMGLKKLRWKLVSLVLL